MSVLPDRLTLPPPFSVKVICEGHPHWLEVRDGVVTAVDHPAEQVTQAPSEGPACLRIITDLEVAGDLLAERESESLRDNLEQARFEPGSLVTPPVRATTTTVPGQLTRLMLLRSIVEDAAIRPDPERFFVSRTRFIADQIYAGTAAWFLEGDVLEGRVLVSDDWLASVFVPGLEIVNGVPISAVRAEEGDIFLLSLIAESDGTIHSRELDWLDAELPAGLMLL